MFFVYCVPSFSLLKSCCTTVIHVKLCKYGCKLVVTMEQFCNPRCMLCIYRSNKSPLKKRTNEAVLQHTIEKCYCEDVGISGDSVL